MAKKKASKKHARPRKAAAPKKKAAPRKRPPKKKPAKKKPAKKKAPGSRRKFSSPTKTQPLPINEEGFEDASLIPDVIEGDPTANRYKLDLSGMVAENGQFHGVTPQVSKFIYTLIANRFNVAKAAREFGVTDRQGRRVVGEPIVKQIIAQLTYRIQKKMADGAGGFIASRLQVMRVLTLDLYNPDPDIRIKSAKALLPMLPDEGGEIDNAATDPVNMAKLPFERQVALMNRYGPDAYDHPEELLGPEMFMTGEDPDFIAASLGLEPEDEDDADFSTDPGDDD